jgi:hypothetical protein
MTRGKPAPRVGWKELAPVRKDLSENREDAVVFSVVFVIKYRP